MEIENLAIVQAMLRDDFGLIVISRLMSLRLFLCYLMLFPCFLIKNEIFLMIMSGAFVVPVVGFVIPVS